MVGKVLGGRYEILERIGTGGMSLVYRARDLTLRRLVAVKILKHQWAEDEEVVRRFDQEARASASLVHPHVVQVYDVGKEEPDLHYIVMELVAGETLRAKLDREGALPVAEAVAIAQQVLDGLAAAHRRGLVHRDIKPQNILLSEDGTVKVADFGIAYAAATGTLVNTGSLLGTVQYFSPEQARGRMVSAQSDLYSVGVVLFEMLTGRLPFEGESAIGVAIKHLQDAAPDVRSLRPEVPAGLAAAVERALAKDPADRFQTALSFRRALDGFGEEGPRTREARAGRRGQRRRWGWAVALGALVVALAAGGWAFSRWLAVPTVVVPDVRGLSLRQAQARLAGLGLGATVAGQSPSNQVAKGRVLYETPPPGSTIKAHQTVALVLSSGPFTVVLPDLTGEDLAQAQSALATLGLKTAVTRVTNPAPAGQVVAQTPLPNRSVAVGTTVHLTVSQGQPATQVTMPNLVGMTVAQATGELAGMNLTLSAPIATYSTQPVNTIIDQNPMPYQILHGTPQVQVWVSQGPSPASAHQPANRAEPTWTIPASVPPASLLKVVVTDNAGNEEVIYQAVNPGVTVRIPFTWYGTSAQVTTYLNGQQQTVVNLGSGQPSAAPTPAPGQP
ncbi:MAG: PASTA domain-containing protein [Firmicutes bacterium]|nr:PASTA domain-containing protein [Alicyclobacillaceae bacterium]MCL6496432.1 PASTA domain-containing protein [Bacillota bacterium]